MGIGAPNGNFYTGAIEFAPNLPWAHDGVVPLAEYVQQGFGIPVALTNDANAAALGRDDLRCCSGYEELYRHYFWGTGVGSGIVINGQMLTVAMVSQVSWVTLSWFQARLVCPCGCGRRGCLETYCSATGVARTAREFLETSDEPSLLREMDPEKTT